MTNSINLCELTESQLKLVIGGSNPFETWNNCLKAAGFPTGSGGATCGSSVTPGQCGTICWARTAIRLALKHPVLQVKLARSHADLAFFFSVSFSQDVMTLTYQSPPAGTHRMSGIGA
jgi:hypothetical protein